LGDDEIGGRRQKVISVIRPDNQLLTLSFDAQTNLLTKYGYLYADPATGDSEIAQTYSGYRTLGKLKLPGSSLVLRRSWGSAPLHPMLYAIAALCGLISDTLTLLDVAARFFPGFPTASHRKDIGVTHLLQDV